MYHKEKVKPMVDEMALFLDKNAEIAVGATTHTSEDE